MEVIFRTTYWIRRWTMLLREGATTVQGWMQMVGEGDYDNVCLCKIWLELLASY